VVMSDHRMVAELDARKTNKQEIVEYSMRLINQEGRSTKAERQRE
jgi:hypothetical protein